jgi:hypothetical protein
MTMPQWLTDILTGPDNIHHDPVNWGAVLGFLTGIGLSIANYVQHSVFDMQNFMTGLGIGIGALGLAIRARDGVPK